MTGLDTLIGRIDHELAAEVKAQKQVWADAARENRERGLRLQRFDATAEHVVQLLRPRMAAFVDRFKAVAKAEPVVREHTRAINVTFAATVAKVNLLFELFPDPAVNHVRLEWTQDIVPVVVRYDKQSVLEFPLDGVLDDVVVQWFDDRIVTFVKVYLEIVRQDTTLREHLKNQLVEDPVTKIRFPSYLAGATLQRDGRTYYFVDEDTRREFEKQPVAK